MSASSPEAHAQTRLILILAISGFASTFAGRAMEPLVGVVARDLQTDPRTIALLSTAYALPYALIQPILGPVGDALGKERIIKICLAALALTLAGCAVATTSETLFALRILSGAAAGGVIPLALALLGDRIDLGQRQVAISRLLVAVVLGQLSGSSLGGIMAGWIGWRGVFWLATFMGTGACAAAILGFAAPPRAGTPFDIASAIARYKVILANPRARALFGLVFVEALAIFGIFPFIAPMLETRGEGGPTEAGLALAGFAIGGLIYSTLVRTMLTYLGLSRMLIGGGLLCGIALVVVGLAGSWKLDAAALTVLGLGFYMLHNSFQTQVTEVAPEARASAVALHAFSFFCGQALAVVLFDLGLRTIGQEPSMAVCAAAVVALGFAASWLLARQPRAR